MGLEEIVDDAHQDETLDEQAFNLSTEELGKPEETAFPWQDYPYLDELFLAEFQNRNSIS